MGISKALLNRAQKAIDEMPGKTETVRIVWEIVEPSPDGPRLTGEVIEGGTFERPVNAPRRAVRRRSAIAPRIG
jgi:hypothetical protein